MAKFGFLKRTHIPAGEAGYRWMDLPEIAPGAKIFLANATQENKEMLEDALGIVASKKSERGGKDSVEKLEAALMEDREMLHRILLKGWSGMFEANDEGVLIPDEAGNPIPIAFTPENALDFCMQIADWLFTRIKEWARDPENFTEMPLRVPPNGNDLGNS